tara:strand:- start:4303 stop:5184 length:882 start_codon:yes stop_codon:yes gene_type:complete
MAKDNRIIQGGELGIGQGSLDGVVEETPAETKGQDTRQYEGDFPDVDMTFLNETLVKYLRKIRPPKATRQDEEVDLLENDAIREIVASVGSELISLDDLHYEQVGYHDGRIVLNILHGRLQLSKGVPLAGFKRGLNKILDAEAVDYYLEEFADVLGIKGDQTRLIDISDPNIGRYFPAVGTLRQLEGDYQVASVGTVQNYHLLLLALPPEDRPKLGLFFKEAHEKKYGPFGQEQGSYSITQEKEVVPITKEPTIIPVVDLIRIGKEYSIKGLKQYMDRLAEFREQLTKIPERE